MSNKISVVAQIVEHPLAVELLDFSGIEDLSGMING
jgi:hypothetical protein